MTARSIRRAIERKAQKQARKEALRENPISHAIVDGADFTEPAGLANPAQESRQISAAQLTANRQNAQLSTGPKSAAAKARTSLNAVKTGLTGRTVLLPTDDASRYEQHLRRFFQTWNPAGERETELVQRLADTQWRLYRIPEIEAGIYALAQIQFAEMFAAYEPAEAAALIQAHAFLVNQKQLNNLSIQEARLHRQFTKDQKELVALQDLRRKQERRSASPQPATAASAAVTSVKPENGFDFSNPSHHITPAPVEIESEGRELTQAA